MFGLTVNSQLASCDTPPRNNVGRRVRESGGRCLAPTPFLLQY